MPFTNLEELSLASQTEQQSSRMVLKEESSYEEETDSDAETDSEEETEDGSSSSRNEDARKVLQIPAKRGNLLPPAQFRAGRSTLNGQQLSLEKKWDFPVHTQKPSADLDVGNLVGGLRTSSLASGAGSIGTPNLNDDTNTCGRTRSFLPPLQKSNSGSHLPQLPPLPASGNPRTRRLLSISRSTPNLLAMTRAPPSKTPSPPLQSEIEEVAERGEIEESEDHAAAQQAELSRGSNNEQTRTGRHVEEDLDDEFDSEWVQALSKGKSASSASLVSLFKIAATTSDTEDDEFASSHVGGDNSASLAECRSFCPTKRSFLQLHPRCRCGDRKKSDKHVKMHHCRGCGQRFNALQNGAETQPQCVVHSGQVRKFGPGKFVWTCCMDKPREAKSVQEFLLLNVPHLGYHI